MNSKPHYHVNVCGGSFEHVRQSFRNWKNETLLYRSDRRMFEGRNEVRALSDQSFDDMERARGALERSCGTRDPHALAARVNDGARNIWIVMAAYED